MTTIDTSASTSAQGYHDSLLRATRAVINASRNVKKQIADPKNVGLTTRITFLDGMEKAVLKQVQETSSTPAGLELAIRLLEGYQSFTKEDYLYVSSLGQQFAPVEEKKLLDAHTKLSEQIIEVQKFLVNGTKQSQAALPATASSSSAGPSAIPVPAGQGTSSSQVVVVPPLQAKHATKDNPFLDLLLKQGNPAIFEQTQKLFQNKRFALTDRQIIKLTQSWGQAINDLIKDSSTVEAKLILIHNLLETLYDRLESNVRRVSEDILVDLESPNI
jgi:hypothetical protein